MLTWASRDETWNPLLVIGSGLAVITFVGLIGWGAKYAWDWRTDYGTCLAGHEEPRHADAWTEFKTLDCGKECRVTVPIHHPAEDWKVWICDRYQYPEGNGPAAGKERLAAYR